MRSIAVAIAVAASVLVGFPSPASATWNGFNDGGMLVPRTDQATGNPIYRPTWGIGVARAASGTGYDVVVNNHAFATGVWQNLGRGSQSYSETNFGNALQGVTKHTHDTHGIRMADFDNDGDQDFFEWVGDAQRDGSGVNRYWRNNGDGTYTYIPDNGTALGFQRGRGGAPFDFDLDGDVDLLSGGVIDQPTPDNQRAVMLRNDNGTYVEVPGSKDVIDVFMNGGAVTDYGPNTSPRLLALNSGGFAARTLVAVQGQSGALSAASPQPSPVSATQARDWILGDFDGDLRPEVLVIRDTRDDSNRLPITYLDIASNGSLVAKAGIPNNTAIQNCAVGVAGDFDNDGDLDVFLGCSDPNRVNVLLLNNGSGAFTIAPGGQVPAAKIVPGAARAEADNAVGLDADGNGTLDVFIGNGFENPQEPDQLLLSTDSGDHWLQIDLVGTTDNRDAVGAAAYVGSFEQGWQVRQVGHAFHKGNDAMTLHFGLGVDTEVAPVIVTWPNGSVEAFTVPNSGADNVDNRISLVQGAGTPASLTVLDSPPDVTDPNPDPDPDPDPPFDPDSPEAQMDRLYQAAFGRPADAAGRAFWIAQLQGGATLLDLANIWVTTPEWAQRYGANPTAAQVVDNLYQNVLGRPGEPGGRNFWIGEIESGRRTVPEVLIEFSESDENRVNLGHGTKEEAATAKMIRLYQAAFGRDPDAGGQAFWVGQLLGGATLLDLANIWVTTPEWQQRYGVNPTAAQVVDNLYQNVLGRPGEPSGRAFWIGEIESGRRTVAQVLVEFSESAENRANTGT